MTALSPVDALPVAAPPSPWLLYAAPTAVFRQLSTSPRPGRALRWLVGVQPLLPLVVGIGSLHTVRQAMLADPVTADRVGAAPFIAASGALVVLVVQVVLLLMHATVFVTVGRALVHGSTSARLCTVWAYGMFPLVLRQLCYVLVILVAGEDWYAAHAGAVSQIDPFMLATAVFLYLGCRHVLQASRWKAVALTGSATLFGALGWFVSLLASG